MAETNFFGKVKNGVLKFFKGIGSFFVKTYRKNSNNYYGRIENIGDFLVYKDHALISALGMDDITFTSANVESCSFLGLGKPIMKKATVQFRIVLDNRVVFPPLVRQKNDVKNLTATVQIEKDRPNFVGSGQIEYGAIPSADCKVYRYDDCFVLLFNLQRQNGDSVERYQELLQYSFSNISSVADKSNVINFKDGKCLRFVSAGDRVNKLFAELRENK